MKQLDIHVVNFEQIVSCESRTLLLKPIDLSPYLAFLILKEWFGLPIPEYNESKIQWHFYLFTPHLAIDVYDWKLETISIEVFKRQADFDEVEKEAAEFIELLKRQIDRHITKIRSADSKAKGFVYKNPFALYFNNAENILKKAAEWRIEETARPSWDMYQLEMSGDFYRAAFFLYVASFEGLLNLIYEIYLNPDLRDERIYTRLQREQVDIKLRLAPTYCVCFNHKVIDAKTEEFHRFQFVIDLRNDFIHANITKQMRNPIVEDDGFVFWVESEQASKFDLPRDASGLDFHDLEFVRKTVLDMVDVVLNAMKPRYKREFSAVIYDEVINVIIEDDDLIIT